MRRFFCMMEEGLSYVVRKVFYLGLLKTTESPPNQPNRLLLVALRLSFLFFEKSCHKTACSSL